MCRLCGSVAPNGSTAASHFCERMNACVCSARTHSFMADPASIQITKGTRGTEETQRFTLCPPPCPLCLGGPVSLRDDDLPNLHRRVGLAVPLQPAVVLT